MLNWMVICQGMCAFLFQGLHLEDNLVFFLIHIPAESIMSQVYPRNVAFIQQMGDGENILNFIWNYGIILCLL